VTLLGQRAPKCCLRHFESGGNLTLCETTRNHLTSSRDRPRVEAPRPAPGTPRSLYALARGADSIPEGLALHLGSPGHYREDYVAGRAVEREAVRHARDHAPTRTECFHNRKRVSDAPPSKPIDTKNIDLDKLATLCRCL